MIRRKLWNISKSKRKTPVAYLGVADGHPFCTHKKRKPDDCKITGYFFAYAQSFQFTGASLLYRRNSMAGVVELKYTDYLFYRFA